jgi:hypothetical protein
LKERDLQDDAKQDEVLGNIKKKESAGDTTLVLTQKCVQ